MIGVIELHNPRALNALTFVLRAMNEQSLASQVKKTMTCVAIHSNSNRAFCSGSDVKAKDYAREFDRKIVLDRGNAVCRATVRSLKRRAKTSSALVRDPVSNRL